MKHKIALISLIIVVGYLIFVTMNYIRIENSNIVKAQQEEHDKQVRIDFAKAIFAEHIRQLFNNQ